MGFGHEMSIEQLTKLLAEEIEYLEDNSRWADPLININININISMVEDIEYLEDISR